MSSITEMLKNGAADLQQELAEEKELKKLTRKQRLEQARDAEKRKLDTSAPAKIDLDAEKAEYLGTLSEFVEEKPPVPEFICPSLARIVPMEPGHLVMIGAHTGKGKSTVVANICHSLWKQSRKTLVISNEEHKKDIYHRIGCIEHGIPLGRVKTRKLEKAEIAKLAETTDAIIEHVNIIDQSYKNNSQYVRSIDGFKHIWENIDFSQYSAVIIDYYQNVKLDTRVPSKTTWQVQEELAAFLDAQKDVISCPIFIFVQLKLFSDEEKELEERIKGRKEIFDKSTFAAEIRAKKDKYMSEWWIHKDRFMDRDGAIVEVGFDKVNNRFVDYVEAFRMKAEAWIRDAAELRSRFTKRDQSDQPDDQSQG